MHFVDVYKLNENAAELKQLSIKREWMDNTLNKHSYHCFPLTLSNGLGWGLSFSKNISFIWDGIDDTDKDHVTILEGNEYCHTNRANATVSFNTNLVFRTENNLSMLQIPVPNSFRKDILPFTILISTSFYHEALPVAIKILQPNIKITIKAGEPIVSIIPLSLGELQGSTIQFMNIKEMKPYGGRQERGALQGEMGKTANWSDFYKNATDHKGNKMGSHETMAIQLNVGDIKNG